MWYYGNTMVFGLVLLQMPWYYLIASLYYGITTIQFCKGHIAFASACFLTNATQHMVLLMYGIIINIPEPGETSVLTLFS